MRKQKSRGTGGRSQQARKDGGQRREPEQGPEQGEITGPAIDGAGPEVHPDPQGTRGSTSSGTKDDDASTRAANTGRSSRRIKN